MRKHKTCVTDFLFSTPSFLSGAGTVLNLAGNFYEFNASESENEADAIALENDFRMVGQDICRSVEEARQNKGDLKS